MLIILYLLLLQSLSSSGISRTHTYTEILYSIVYCLRVSGSRVISAVFNDFAGLVPVAEASGETIVMVALLSCTASSEYTW